MRNMSLRPVWLTLSFSFTLDLGKIRRRGWMALSPGDRPAQFVADRRGVQHISFSGMIWTDNHTPDSISSTVTENPPVLFAD
jgi:hypothetical protein